MSDRQEPLPFGGVGAIGQMIAHEGWIVIGDDAVTWMHPPSSRVLNVWRHRRRECASMGCWGPEPTDPETEGYSITLRVHDDMGNPVSGEGFWIASYDQALVLARRIRAAVMARPTPPMRQLTLDEIAS